MKKKSVIILMFFLILIIENVTAVPASPCAFTLIQPDGYSFQARQYGDECLNWIGTFRVENSWVTDNDIEETTISLYRYSGNKWNKLVTRMVNEDSRCLYFEAEVPGFSPFAITGMKTGKYQSDDDIKALPTSTAEKLTATQTEEKGIPGFDLSACLLMLLMAVQLLHKKH